jgi:hypothetical protein
MLKHSRRKRRLKAIESQVIPLIQSILDCIPPLKIPQGDNDTILPKPSSSHY